MDNLYVGKTHKDYHLEVEKVRKEYPQLDVLFGGAWMDQFSHQTDASSMHPFFWVLANPYLNKRFTEGLIYLSQNDNRYPSYIKELRAASTYAGAISSSVEVVAYHQLSKSHRVTWKPVIPNGNKGKGPDLLIEGGLPIYLEICTITDSEKDVRQQEARDELQKSINLMTNNPFIVSANYEGEFKKEHVPQVVKLLQDEVAKFQSDLSDHELSCEIDPDVTVELRLYPSEDGNGFYGSGGFGGPFNNIGRVKFRILSKLAKFQLPSKDPSHPHLNGLLIFLEPVLYTTNDVLAAVKGQPTLSFTLGGDGTPINVYNDDGADHHPDWSKLVAHVDFIASSKIKNGEILLPDHSYLLFNNAQMQHRADVSKRLFGI